MTQDEIRTTLFASAKLRVPKFDDRDSTGARIDKMEQFLLASATTGGDLEEARLHCQQALYDLTKRWDAIPLLQGPKAMTGPQIIEHRKTIDPALWEGIQEAKWLIARLTEQIQRLRKMGDDQVVSRIYTLMAGS